MAKAVTINSVTVGGTQLAHQFNLSTGALVANGLNGASTDIITYLQDGTAPVVKTAEAILIPQTAAITVKIAATVDGTDENLQLHSRFTGFCYQYKIYVGIDRRG